MCILAEVNTHACPVCDRFPVRSGGSRQREDCPHCLLCSAVEDHQSNTAVGAVTSDDVHIRDCTVRLEDNLDLLASLATVMMTH